MSRRLMAASVILLVVIVGAIFLLLSHLNGGDSGPGGLDRPSPSVRLG